MARKAKAKLGMKRTTKTPQLVVRVSGELDGHLRAAAQGLGLDLSGLVRMMLTEHVAAYIERGLAAKARANAAERSSQVRARPRTRMTRKSSNATSTCDAGRFGQRIVQQLVKTNAET